MTAQVIHLSSEIIFQKYSGIINSNKFIYDPGSFLFAVRGMDNSDLNILKDFNHDEKLCFIKNDSSDIFFFNKSIIEINNAIIAFPDGKFKKYLEQTLKNYFTYDLNSFSIGKKEFCFNKSYVMGILNVTPDSFSDGGLYLNTDDAVNHALEMLNDGADIIDVGGESTRPGSDAVSEKEELNRVIPVVKKILSAEPDAVISIDTTKSRVAEEAINFGAKIINDISGTTFDETIINVAAKNNAAVIIMHIKGIPKTMQQNPNYENLIEEVYDFLSLQTAAAKNAGVKNIFIDPGIGFGKKIKDNFEILNRLEDFKSLGYPIVIGVSRKSFIGKNLNLDIDERDTATAIAETVAVKNGAMIIRTHNVKFGKQVSELLNNLRY